MRLGNFQEKWISREHPDVPLTKEAKLRNAAPIKYHIEVAQKYWETIFRSGTRRIKLLSSGQIRQVRDVCIFQINGMEVIL